MYITVHVAVLVAQMGSNWGCKGMRQRVWLSQGCQGKCWRGNAVGVFDPSSLFSLQVQYDGKVESKIEISEEIYDDYVAVEE